MSQILRQPVPVGKEFSAPVDATFGYQKDRSEFSIWYRDDAAFDTTFIVVPTGQEFDSKFVLLDSVNIDGFHIFHFLRDGAPK